VPQSVTFFAICEEFPARHSALLADGYRRQAGGYVMLRCGFAALGHSWDPWSNPFYSLLIAHRLIVFVRNRIHVAEAVTGPFHTSRVAVN
jgi:hypothetical protein